MALGSPSPLSDSGSRALTSHPSFSCFFSPLEIANNAMEIYCSRVTLKDSPALSTVMARPHKPAIMVTRSTTTTLRLLGSNIMHKRVNRGLWTHGAWCTPPIIKQLVQVKNIPLHFMDLDSNLQQKIDRNSNFVSQSKVNINKDLIKH
jgi:hypothetical protein